MTPGLLPYISWSVCTVKSHSILHLFFSITTFNLCSYHISFTSVPHFLHISQWIFVRTQSCFAALAYRMIYTPFSFSTHSIVCLINCPCNYFCVHCVFLPFFFLCLYSFGVFLSSSSSIVRAAINNFSLLFLTQFLNPKLLCPQYLGFNQSTAAITSR